MTAALVGEGVELEEAFSDGFDPRSADRFDVYLVVLEPDGSLGDMPFQEALLKLDNVLDKTIFALEGAPPEMLEVLVEARGLMLLFDIRSAAELIAAVGLQSRCTPAEIERSAGEVGDEPGPPDDQGWLTELGSEDSSHDPQLVVAS